jgi:hypothetical protein
MSQTEEEMEYPEWRSATGTGTTPAVPVQDSVSSNGVKRWVPLLLCLLLPTGLAVTGGSFYVWRKMTGDNEPILRSAVEFRSNAGHLDKAWFREYTGLSNPQVNSVTVQNIKDKLAFVGQIRRMGKPDRHLWDDGVDFEVEERVPVFRYMYRDSKSAKEKLHLVDRDGVVYQGAKYKPEFLDNLPWLMNAKPVLPVVPVVPEKPKADAKAKEKGKTSSAASAKTPAKKTEAPSATPPEKPKEPDPLPRIPGVREMAMLVDLARRNTPEFYKNWEYISAEEFTEGNPKFTNAHIRVRLRSAKISAGAPRLRDLVFSADPEQYAFEFSAYASPEVRTWIVRQLAELGSRESPLFDLWLSLADKTGANAANPVKQVHLIPVMPPVVTSNAKPATLPGTL